MDDVLESQEVLTVLNSHKYVPSEYEKAAICKMLLGESVVFISASPQEMPTFIPPVVDLVFREPRPQFALCLCCSPDRVSFISRKWSDWFQMSLHLRVLALHACSSSRDFTTEAEKLRVKEAVQKPHILVATIESVLWHMQHKSHIRWQSIRHVIVDQADTITAHQQQTLTGELIKLLNPAICHVHLFASKKVITLVDELQGLLKVQFQTVEEPLAESSEDDDDEDAKHEFVLPGGLNQHSVALVPEGFRDVFLVALLNGKALMSSLRVPRAVLFASRWRDVVRIAALFQECGIPTDYVHGQLSEDKREMAIQRFQEAQIRVLACTEVPLAFSSESSLTSECWVLHYDVPTSAAAYVRHCALFAEKNVANRMVTLVTQYSVFHWKRLEMNLKLEKGGVVPLFPVKYKETVHLEDKVRTASKSVEEEIKKKEERLRHKMGRK